jgi:5-methylcytosine-specific restriction enzyme B
LADWSAKPLALESVLAAIDEFDRDDRDAVLDRHGFQRARDWLVVHNGREYDSKALYGIAYGIQYPDEEPIRLRGLQGGGTVLRRLRALGFEIRSMKAGASALRDGIEAILSAYLQARAVQPFGSSAPIWETFRALGSAFNDSPPVANRDTVQATWSAGAGNWARVPWVAFLDSRETATTQRGVYPALLFRQDMTGAYMTLAQGVTEPKKLGRAEATAFLQGVATRVRAQSSDLAAGFALDGNIDLRSEPGLGRDYEISTIAHKLYPAGEVPADDQIVDTSKPCAKRTTRTSRPAVRTRAALRRLRAPFASSARTQRITTGAASPHAKNLQKRSLRKT